MDLPYGVILHGTEVTVPARLPGSRSALIRVLRQASLVIAGGVSGSEAARVVSSLPPVAWIPPGVDTARFLPLAPIERASTRARLGLPTTGPLVLCVSRLVPRKGVDTLIEAAARLSASGRFPDLSVVVAGEGRDRRRLEHLIAKTDAPVRLLGRIPSPDLPGLYACADVFVLCCRSRWGGLEQEGFGIVFLEAAAAGIPSVAGDSGGSAEAVLDGETGIVLHHSTDRGELAAAIGRLLSDPALASAQGQAARHRAETEFDYDLLADRLERGNRPDGAAAKR